VKAALARVAAAVMVVVVVERRPWKSPAQQAAGSALAAG